eukprot:UN31860
MGAACCAADKDNVPVYTARLDSNRVNATWNEKEGTGSVRQKQIDRILKESDDNNDGELQRDEATALLKKLYERSDLSKDNAGEYNDDTGNKLFTALDENNDGRISRAEIEVALKAMWLMDRQGVTFQELCDPVEEKEDRGAGLPPTTTATVDDHTDESVKVPDPVVKTNTDNAPVENNTASVSNKTTQRLDPEKVQAVWDKKRSHETGPSQEHVSKAINRSDVNKDGKIDFTEAERIIKAFCKKGKITNLDSKVVFDYMDRDRDGVLSREEVELAMKAMYL